MIQSLWLLNLLVGVTAPLPAGDHERAVVVGERSRSYLVHVPATASPPAGFPVVLVFHGLGFDAAGMARFTGMNDKADQAGFVVAYPEGTGSGVVRVFNGGAFKGKLAAELPDDVAMTARLLDDLASVIAVDSRRIFAAGMSNGGMMCYRLAAELPDRIAAVASVAGTMPRGLPAPRIPVPVLHFHGTADRVVPMSGPPDEAAESFDFASVEETIQFWRAANHCSAVPHATKVPDDRPGDLAVVRTEYQTADGDARVVLVTVEGGGHTWPGRPGSLILGRCTQAVSANDWIWTFFQQHPRP
jgi:polyhydroxybutyrate depolymerase